MDGFGNTASTNGKSRQIPFTLSPGSPQSVVPGRWLSGRQQRRIQTVIDYEEGFSIACRKGHRARFDAVSTGTTDECLYPGLNLGRPVRFDEAPIGPDLQKFGSVHRSCLPIKDDQRDVGKLANPGH